MILVSQKAIEDRWRQYGGAEDPDKLDAGPKEVPVLGSYNPMNKTETKFSIYLDQLKAMGEIREWRFEPFKFILSHSVKGKRRATTYTPDFLTVGKEFTLYEVKGFMRDDAAVKIKVAAEMFPWFDWVLVYLQKGEWIFKGV